MGKHHSKYALIASNNVKKKKKNQFSIISDMGLTHFTDLHE